MLATTLNEIGFPEATQEWFVSLPSPSAEVTTLEAHLPMQSFCQQAVLNARKGSRTAHRQNWTKLHNVVEHVFEPGLGPTPKRHGQCIKFGMCLHNGFGIYIKRCADRLVKILKEDCMTTNVPENKAIVDNGFVVLHFVGEDSGEPLAQRAHLNPEREAATPYDLWWHVSVVKYKPLSMEFLMMEKVDRPDFLEWVPLEDEIFLKPLGADDSTVAKDLWEVFADLNLDLHWEVEYFEIERRSIPVTQIFPGRISVRRNIWSCVTFWISPF